MEVCGLAFSACFNCISSGNYLVKLASNFSYCCSANPATLAEPVMITYSKLSECPPNMMSTYILAGTIGSIGLLACFILLGIFLVNCTRRRQTQGRRMPISRVRFQREDVPLLATVADLPDGQPNYGFDQEVEQSFTSHESAARCLGSIPSPLEQHCVPVNQVPVANNDYVYCETVAPTTFRAKRPTTLSINNPIYENTRHFPIV